jgi:[CysO sulfur-carrier protein]-S-L-cysteine hydrolase
MFPRLVIPRAIFSAMLAQADDERPFECCGLLAGNLSPGDFERRVSQRYALVNAAASPVEYESDPRSILDAFKDMRRCGWDLVGIYHSHPTSPPVPSGKDLERNSYGAEVVHFIISLQFAQPEVRGWRLSPTSYAEADWTCVDD